MIVGHFVFLTKFYLEIRHTVCHLCPISLY